MGMIIKWSNKDKMIICFRDHVLTYTSITGLLSYWFIDRELSLLRDCFVEVIKYFGFDPVFIVWDICFGCFRISKTKIRF